MSLQHWLHEGKLRPHQTSAKEIGDLLKLVDRDLADAAIPQVSTDRRYATAYGAALALATIVLHAGGYRATGVGHHWTTIQMLSELLGPQAQGRTDYLNHCRTRRNTADYDQAGVISETEAQDLATDTRAFRADIVAWLQEHHPVLLSSE